ncbi:uncharacterized protein [Centruroides vittatus]|uniref:uncharacterized protein n=1 Tax=Centruroides vittatus TaxID=120091 RepID=UPI0035100B32
MDNATQPNLRVVIGPLDEEVPQATAPSSPTSSTPSTPAASCTDGPSTATAEGALLQSAGRHLRRILDLLPAHYRSGTTVRDKKEIKERAARMFAAINQMYGMLTQLRESQAAPATTLSYNEPEILKPPTYSDIVKSNIIQSSTTKAINRSLNNKIKHEGSSSSYALIVYPKEAEGPEKKTINMEKIYKKITNNIKPDQLKIKVTSVKQVKGDGICFRTANSKDAITLEKAVTELSELKEEIKTKISEGRRPRIILKNVPKSVKDDNVITTIYAQNEQLKGISEEEFMAQTRLSTVITRGNLRENCRHIVLSTSPLIRNQLIKEKYISISWANIQIDDYVHITRCYKCCGYNHIANNCTSRQSCSHCSKGHKFTDCTRREQPACCINCKSYNKDLPPDSKHPTNHNAFDQQCPNTMKVKEQTIKQTNYGF